MLSTSDPTPPWVDAAPFRAHLHFLMGVGSLGLAQIAALTGLPPIILERLEHSRPGTRLRRISPFAARRLISLTPEMVSALPRLITPAARARRCLIRLGRSGVDLPALAARAGVTVPELERLAAGERRCSAWLTLQLSVAAQSLEQPPGRSDRVVLFDAA